MPVDKFGRMSDLKTKDTGVSLTYINNNYVRSDGETPLTGSLDMRGNTLYNVADPVNPQDVVTKVYVDNTKGSGVIGRKVGDAVSIKENLDFLEKQKIKNLPDPVNDHDAVTKKYVDEKDAVTKEYVDEKDAVTKKYVDDKTKNLFIDKNDNIAFGLNVDMEGNKIFSLPKPEQDHEPATKKYVDDLQTHYIDKRGNAKFERNINVGNNRIFALKDPKKDYEATNKKYVDDSITKRLQEEKDNFLPQDPATKEYVDEAIKGLAGGDLLVSKEGVFIKANGHYRATAPLDIDNHKMENLPDPVDDKDAVNKKYVDDVTKSLTLEEVLIKENGGYNIGDSYINMNFNNIRNVGLPKDESDAVPRRFVEDMVKNKKHLIAVHARYCGPLKSADFPFKFGGVNNFENCEEKILKGADIYKYKIKGLINGFVMPHSGRIKKIICESLTFLDKNEIIDKLIKNFRFRHIEELEKHFGKKDFKNDLLKLILNKISFTYENNEKKESLFEIARFKKRKEGETKKILGFSYTLPILGEKTIISKFTWEEVKIENNDYILTIMKTLNNETIPLNEGETINIKIISNSIHYHTDLIDGFIDDIKTIDDIFNLTVIRLLGELNFNFTFLIELDPL